MSFAENKPRQRRSTDSMVRVSSLYCMIFALGPDIAKRAGLTAGGRCRVFWGSGDDLYRIRLVPCGESDGYAVQSHVKHGKALRIAFKRPDEFPPVPVFSPKVKTLESGIELDCAAVVRDYFKKQERERGLVVNFK